ncbi:hypothetical protein BG006_007856 [Podila minutissima]|uniref:WRKY domain-containing protein n=1 Tax=Podila minutissima TaxID=64525 RepID=A0A9P5VQB5_9FUNG|nr:hypothetical protein BG006_007856 [Podila minutissima]
MASPSPASTSSSSSSPSASSSPPSSTSSTLPYSFLPFSSSAPSSSLYQQQLGHQGLHQLQHQQYLLHQNQPLLYHQQQQQPGVQDASSPQSPVDADGEYVTSGPSEHPEFYGFASGDLPVSVSMSGSDRLNSSLANPLSLLPLSPASFDDPALVHTAGTRQQLLQRHPSLQLQMHMPPHSSELQPQDMAILGQASSTLSQPLIDALTPYASQTEQLLQRRPPQQQQQQQQQQSQASSSSSSLPTPPPQTADLDTILATYASQPELLKLIIASKTEEDRRWAEEAKLKMMDLMMRGESRSFATGYEALLGDNTGGSGSNPVAGSMMASDPFTRPPGQGSGGGPSKTMAMTTASLPSPSSSSDGTASDPTLLAMSMPPGHISPTGPSNPPNLYRQSFGGSGRVFGQLPDPSTVRKRSVTFAGEVHGHMRSQSMSSMPSTSDQYGDLSLGLGPYQYRSQQYQPVLYPLQQMQQQLQQVQQQQAQQQAQQVQQASVQLQQQSQGLGQYPQAPPVAPQNVIRRTSSLSHISQTQQQIRITEQRLVAGRPRNDSASSFRTVEDSDEDSDDDYSDHPVAGMSSRPGSALSMYNNVGGTGETSLTLDFSDMTSLSGGHVSNRSSLNEPRDSPSSTQGASRIISTLANMDQKRKRKRREMQPVSKVVDSPEPHIDYYVWKNNGNTVQKKTGCKSIYFKCSNSAAGCTTVTEKEGGGYLTKYRGEHLEDCMKMQRAQMAQESLAYGQALSHREQ